MPALVINCAVIGESHSPNSHTALPAAVIFNPCLEEQGRLSSHRVQHAESAAHGGAVSFAPLCQGHGHAGGRVRGP